MPKVCSRAPAITSCCRNWKGLACGVAALAGHKDKTVDGPLAAWRDGEGGCQNPASAHPTRTRPSLADPALTAGTQIQVLGAPVRILFLDRWVPFTAKEQSRKRANEQLSIASAAEWIVTRPQIKKLSCTIKKAAIKNIMDGIKTLVVELRSTLAAARGWYDGRGRGSRARRDRPVQGQVVVHEALSPGRASTESNRGARAHGRDDQGTPSYLRVAARATVRLQGDNQSACWKWRSR